MSTLLVLGRENEVNRGEHMDNLVALHTSSLLPDATVAGAHLSLHPRRGREICLVARTLSME